MTGRISRLIDDQQVGTIAAEDGADYVFHSRSLVGTTFGFLHVGAMVMFTPISASGTPRAESVRIASK